MEDIKETIEKLSKIGLRNCLPLSIQVADPKPKVEYLLKYFIGENYEWQPEYDKVVEWLADNKNKGLLCSGTVGRGKSVLCCKALPVILNRCLRLIANVIDAPDLNTQEVFNAAKKHAITVIDDIGIEPESYGVLKLNEIVKAAEDNGRLLIITTNLTGREIESRYGERTLSRLIGMCKCIRFQGEDMRRKINNNSQK